MSLAAKIAERGFESDDDSDDGSPKSTTPFSCGAALSSAALQVLVYLKLNMTDIKARKGTYCLGFVSCTIVVLITALMITVLGRLPILFLRLAEIDKGEADLILTPGGQASDAQSLNYSKVLYNSAFVAGASSYHAPRMALDKILASVHMWPLSKCPTAAGAVPSPSSGAGWLSYLWTPNPNVDQSTTKSLSSGGTTQSTCSAKLGCAAQYCSSNFSVAPAVFAIDFAREQRMGLGREWKTPSPGLGGCILHADLASRIGVVAGDTILLQADVSYSLLQPFIEAELDDWLSEPYTTWGRVLLPLTVKSLVSSGHGKFSDSMDDFLLLDYQLMLQTMAPYLNPMLGSRKRLLFANANPNEAATQIVFELPPDERIAVYSQSDNKAVLSSITAFATPIIAILGFNQVFVDTPISDYIQANSFFSLFLGLILSLMILGLSFLCIVLIYSLLTVGIETRTFELGIMRMVGMTRPMLTGYVIMGALLFAIPAWAIGLALAQIGFVILVGQLQSALGVTLSVYLTPDAIGYATLAGFGMPLISSIAPIVSVLALDLPKALDVNRSRTEAIIYDIERTGEHRVNLTVVGLGIFMAVAGFLIYYLFPLALLTFNITLLFYIFFGILMGMLFGLVLLATSFQGLVETAVQYIFLFWETPAVFQLIKKNLVAHRRRNSKTSLMFAMSIGFLIFLSVTFTIQIQSVVYASERSYGAQISIEYDGSDDLAFYTIEVIDLTLRNIRDRPSANTTGPVRGLKWTWATSAMTSQPYIDNASVTSVGRYVTLQPTLQAVAPNFWDTVNSRYFISSDIRPSSWDMGYSLYSYEGSQRAVISTSYHNQLALQGQNAAFAIPVKVQIGNDTRDYVRLAQSDAFMDSSSVVTFSKYTPNRNAVVVSLPALMHRGEGVIPSIEMLVFSRFVVSMDSDGDVDRVIKVLNTALTDYGLNGITKVKNLLSVQSSLEVAVNVVNLFFTFAQAMASCICFFALSSSMSTNVHEQSKEIGILRSIGLRKFPLTRTYIWESFVLVLAASILGVCVGVVMGYTIVLQRALFTQLPLPFVFPWGQVIAILILSFVFAWLSSWAPIRSMLNSGSVTSILRRAL